MLTTPGLPHQVRKKTGQFDPARESIKVMNLHPSKGMEFLVMALVGVCHMPAQGVNDREEARLLYVGAALRLAIEASGAGRLAVRL